MKETIADTSTIVEVIPKYPELMSSDFADVVRGKHARILFLRDELDDARGLVRKLEKELDSAESAFRDIDHLFEMIHGTKEIEIAEKSDNNLIVFGTDGRILKG